MPARFERAFVKSKAFRRKTLQNRQWVEDPEIAAKTKQRFLRTMEDWARSFAAPDHNARGASPQAVEEGDAWVLARLVPERAGLGGRVVVQGNDDFSLEKMFPLYEEALQAFEALTEPVLKNELRTQGFRNG